MFNCAYYHLKMNPLLLIIAAILLLLYIFKDFNRRPLNFPPGPPRLPVYGSYWFLLFANYKYTFKAIDYLARRYRTKVLGFYMGGFATVVACDHDSIKEVLTKPEFQGRMDTFVIRDRQLGKLIGIFFVDGPSWKNQRRFTLRYMRDYGFGCRSVKQENMVQHQVQDILDILRGRRIDTEVFRDGYALVPRLFCHIFVNALWNIFCGDTLSHEDQTFSKYLVDMAFGFQRSTDATGLALGITPWLRYTTPSKFGLRQMRLSNGKMLESLQKSIDEHLETYSEDHIRDFIDVYIKEMKSREDDPENREFTAEQLVVVGLDLLLPTLTTLNSTLTYLVHYLVRCPQIQSKMQQAIDTVVGRDRLPILDDRPRLPYIEATIREVLRIETIVPLGVAHRATEDAYLGGYFVPKDTMVMTSLYTYHHDPEIWKDPGIFRPERFLDERGQLLKKDMTLPFGAGKRLCVGETFSRHNMFLVMAALLQNFSFVGPVPDLESINGLIMFPKEFWVKIETRN